MIGPFAGNIQPVVEPVKGPCRHIQHGQSRTPAFACCRRQSNQWPPPQSKSTRLRHPAPDDPLQGLGRSWAAPIRSHQQHMPGPGFVAPAAAAAARRAYSYAPRRAFYLMAYVSVMYHSVEGRRPRLGQPPGPIDAKDRTARSSPYQGALRASTSGVEVNPNPRFGDAKSTRLVAC